MALTIERIAQADALQLQANLAHLKSICGDDPDLLADMIEGELDIDRFVSKLVTLIAEGEADVDGLKLYSRKVADRKKRLEARNYRLRVLLASVVINLPDRKFKNPLAAVRAFSIEPQIVIDEEADIPTQWWKTADPVIDAPALRKHLNARRKALEELADCRSSEERDARLAEINRELPDVPGVHLDNGDISVSITVA